jgi:hypothetical protein
MGLAPRRRGGLFRPCEAGEPRLDRGERAHEAAGLKKLAAPATAFRQIAVERFLIDLVHVEHRCGSFSTEAAGCAAGPTSASPPKVASGPNEKLVIDMAVPRGVRAGTTMTQQSAKSFGGRGNPAPTAK